MNCIPRKEENPMYIRTPYRTGIGMYWKHNLHGVKWKPSPKWYAFSRKNPACIKITSKNNKSITLLCTGNDRYSGKNGQGFLFHYSGCFHYSGRLLYGTQHISSPSFQFKNEILTSFTSMVGWGLESCVAIAFKTEFWLRLLQWFLIGSKILVFESHAVSFWPQEKEKILIHLIFFLKIKEVFYNFELKFSKILFHYSGDSTNSK